MTLHYPALFKRGLTKHEAEHPAYSLQKEMNDLLNRFFKGWDFPAGGGFDEFTSYTPRIDVKETDNELIVAAELPGLTEKDVTVSVAKDYLTISGEKKSEKEEDVKGYYHMERTYGSFRRTIPLPYEVHVDRAQATFKDGLLTVSLPKTPETQKGTKTIAVNKG